MFKTTNATLNTWQWPIFTLWDVKSAATVLNLYLQVIMIVFSPSQEGLSAMTFAWVVTSWGDSWGDSLGCVWIHPRGSISYEIKEAFKWIDTLCRLLITLNYRRMHASKILTFKYSCCGSWSGGQVNGLMRTPLWHHHDTANFLYLRVIWRAGSIQITCNLQEKNMDTIKIQV